MNHKAQLQNKLNTLTQVPYNFTSNSLLAAAKIAIRTCKLKKEDEIILSAMMPPALGGVFFENGVKPLWCDIRLDGNIDEGKIETLITPRTKAILVHDFAGTPVNIVQICAIAKKHHLTTIHITSIGAQFEKKPTASFADITLISTITGGAFLCTKDHSFAQHIEMLLGEGKVNLQNYNYDLHTIGFDTTMAECVAKEELVHLQNLETILQKKEAIAQLYTRFFQNEKLFLTQKITPEKKSAWDFYPIILNPQLHCPKQDIYTLLQAKGVKVEVHYKPLYQLSYFKQKFPSVSLHVTNDFYLSELSLPCDIHLSTKEVEKIATVFLETIHKYRYRGCSF